MNTIRHIFSSSATAEAPQPSVDGRAPGTKLSYRSGRADRAGDSTVVVLKTGDALELRRGAVTKFDQRRKWPSVAAWISSLPAGADVMETKSSATAAKPETHPDFQKIALFLAKHGCGRSWNTAVKSSLHRIQTNAEKIEILKLKYDRCNTYMTYYPSSSPHYATYLQTMQQCMQQCDVKIKKLQAKPEKPLTYYLSWKKNCSNALIYGSNGDGLKAIAINVKDGLFGMRGTDGKIRIVSRLADLGCESYFVRVGEEILPLFV